MRKTVRILTMAGMALVAGAAIGASPAQATSTGKAATTPSLAQVQQNREWVAGYYRSHRSCERAGWIGERFNRWGDYDCDLVRYGYRRGWWELEVESRYGRYDDDRRGRHDRHDRHDRYDRDRYDDHDWKKRF